MKRFSFLLLLLTLAIGCDSPQRGRETVTPAASNALSQGTTTGSNFSNGSSTGTTTSGTTTGGTTSGVIPGFESCDISTKYYSADLGAFGLCQSTSDETLLLFLPTVTNTSIRTCLIPTYKDASGSSTYLGQPQCTYTQANVKVQGRLYKNRTGFESYPISGVMVLKENLLNPYFSCMNAYASYVSQACPMGARTNSVCDSYAQQYRDQVCMSFKSQYGSSYVDIRLKSI